MTIFKPRRPTALIVGASIEGLLTAKGLQRYGWKVTVAEQEPSWTQILNKANRGAVLLRNAFLPLQFLDAVPDDAHYTGYYAWRNRTGCWGLPYVHSCPSNNSRTPPYDGILYTSQLALLQKLFNEMNNTNHLIQHHCSVEGIVPVDFQFNSTLSKVSRFEHRGHFCSATGEFHDPHIEAHFVPTELIKDAKNRLEKETKVDQLNSTTILQSDTLLIADGAPSWAKRRILTQLHRSLPPVYRDTIMIEGVLKATDLPDEIIQSKIEYATFEKQESFFLFPINKSRTDYAFIAILRCKMKDIPTQRCLARYDGPLVEEMKEMLTQVYRDFHGPIPTIIQRIVDHKTLQIKYNPLHWRDYPIFCTNRVAYIGEAAKLHFPTYYQTCGIDITDAWSLILHLGKVTNTEMIRQTRATKHLKVNKDYPDRGNFSCSLIYEIFSSERNKTRSLPKENADLIGAQYARKYVGKKHFPFANYSVPFRRFIYKYRVLPAAMKSNIQTVKLPPRNLARSIDGQIAIGAEERRQHERKVVLIQYCKDIWDALCEKLRYGYFGKEGFVHECSIPNKS